MRIVHLSKLDAAGGAARAAYRLHTSLRSLGQDSSMLVASRTSGDPSVKAVSKPMGPISVAVRGIRQLQIEGAFNGYVTTRPKGLDLFSDDRASLGAALISQIPSCDVINLHWISGFVDYTHLFSQSQPAKLVVWTLHDLNPMTGGCHYASGCDGYTKSCGACPQLGSQDKTDLSSQIWRRKNQIFSGLASSQLCFVAPSRWLGEEARRSSLISRFPVHVIPNGIDVQEFAPRPKQSARELLGIPANASVLLFLAESVDATRKGFRFLIEALRRLAGTIPNLMLLSLGQNKPEVEINVPWMHLGSLSNDRFLSIAYSAADTYAICSEEDNLPNTVLEAMACGVPVVGHRTGGIPDMVRDGITGRTVTVGDSEQLAVAIAEILNCPKTRERMGECARRIAVDEYSVRLQGQRYADLYASLLNA